MAQLIVGLLMIAIAGILLFWGQQCARDGWARMTATPKGSPVTITPDTFSFGDEHWAPRTTLFVTNTTGKPLYSVSISIIATNSRLDCNHIKIAVDKRELAPKLESKEGRGAVVLDTDFLIIYGTENSTHAAYAQIQFHVIGPGDTRRMTVWSDAWIRSEARAKVDNFSEVESPVGEFIPQESVGSGAKVVPDRPTATASSTPPQADHAP